ncbi:hypothetical protein Tco_1413620 [Tanacetum coccineum]
MDYSRLNKAKLQGHVSLIPEEGKAKHHKGISYKCFPPTSEEYINQIRLAEMIRKTGFHTKKGVYFSSLIIERIKELRCYTSEDDGKVLSRSKRTKRGNTLGGHSNKKQKVKEGKFLGHIVTKARASRARADHRTIQAITLRLPYNAQVANIGHPQRRRDYDVMSTTKNGDNKFCTIDREGSNPDTCFLCEPTSTRNRDMLHPNRKKEEILKLFGKEGRLGKWAAEIHTYDISYIPRKEAKGLVMKKFFGQGEHVEGTLDANEGGSFTLSEKLQAKSTPTPRAWRLYVGKEIIEEGSGVGIILVSPKEKMHSYAIRLKFHASNHVMDYEA